MPISCEGLVYAYRRGTPRERVALRGAGLRVAGGECLGILGGRGAGKSTLALILAGLIVPDAGVCALDGRELRGKAGRRELLRTVGYLPQWPERHLFGETVMKDVTAGLPRAAIKSGEGEKVATAALSSLGLEPGVLGERPIFHLSGGEARRVALAGILVLGRPVAILDEPTAGLDPGSRRAVLCALANAKCAGTTLLVISHDLEELAGLADRYLILEGGAALFTGTFEELLDRQAGDDPLPIELPPLAALRMRLQRRFPDEAFSFGTAVEAAAEIVALLRRRQRPRQV